MGITNRTDSAISGERGYAPRRPRWGMLALVVLLHLAALAGLVRAFAPELPAAAMGRVRSLVTVTLTAPPPPEATLRPEPQPSSGAAAAAGPEAIPREVVAPPAPILRQASAPRVASTGSADQAGAARQGEGTGAVGTGDGIGSGNSGAGRGGSAVTKPEKIAGDIRSAGDYPVPPGGRQARFGQSVTIAMTVSVDGRASNCRVIRPSNDPAADRITCELAVERFRFRPATDAKGDPVPATYGWRQDFFASG